MDEESDATEECIAIYHAQHLHAVCPAQQTVKMFEGRAGNEELSLWQASVNLKDERKALAFPFPAHESDYGFRSSLNRECRFDARWDRG